MSVPCGSALALTSVTEYVCLFVCAHCARCARLQSSFRDKVVSEQEAERERRLARLAELEKTEETERAGRDAFSFRDGSSAFDESVTSEFGLDKLSPPPDFSDVEHGKSFYVGESNGVNIMLMTSLGKVPEREKASVGVQVLIDRGFQSMFIFGDDRSPVRPMRVRAPHPTPTHARTHTDTTSHGGRSFVCVQVLSAVFQPAQEGHIVRLASTHAVSPATTLDAEMVVRSSLLACAFTRDAARYMQPCPCVYARVRCTT